MSNKELDPYTAKAEDNHLSPQEKIQNLQNIVKSVKTGMLTTRSSSGALHSRAMAPAGRKSPYPVPTYRHLSSFELIVNMLSFLAGLTCP